jgi:glucose-1-phosphate thymidylyltransferase
MQQLMISIFYLFISCVVKMDAVVLAGGFARRMLPLTKDKPKHLLLVRNKPMLQYVLEKLEVVSDVHKIYISTNARFKHHFASFLRDYKNKNKNKGMIAKDVDVKLVIEDAFSEGEKLGSLGALEFLIKKEGIEDELMIVGGDNLFQFSLNELVAFYREKGCESAIAVYDVGSREKAKLYGIVALDEDNKIIDFVEKSEEPKSYLAATACYMLSPRGVKLLLNYLEEGNNPDALGNFIAWLHKRTPVYGYVFKGVWFDIGSLESYEEANRTFIPA